MTRFAIDTCSLIALYYSGYLGDTIKALNLVITNKIHYELEEMGKYLDDDGSAALEVLTFLTKIKILETQPKSTGEEELIEIAIKHECDFIVSDDIRAISVLKRAGIPLIFSTHLLYYLYKKGKVSKEEGLIALEKMRNRRTWKNNLIYIAGIQLFK
jgi:rRNA-processing protein FCF1